MGSTEPLPAGISCSEWRASGGWRASEQGAGQQQHHSITRLPYTCGSGEAALQGAAVAEALNDAQLGGG